MGRRIRFLPRESTWTSEGETNWLLVSADTIAWWRESRKEGKKWRSIADAQIAQLNTPLDQHASHWKGRVPDSNISVYQGLPNRAAELRAETSVCAPCCPETSWVAYPPSIARFSGSSDDPPAFAGPTP